jgi:Flp pilus assembly protein TadD
MGEYRKAMEGLPDPKSEPAAAARLELAALLMTDGKGGEAVKLAREVVAARGDDGAALDALGRACDLTKDVGCARGAYDKLARLEPGQGSASKEAVEHARARMKVLKSARPTKARKRKR